MLKGSQWFLDAPQCLAVRQASEASLAAGWVRMRFLFCGICGSDLSAYEGRREIEYPRSLGHEFIAEVVEIGDGVDGFAPGDLVTSDLNYRCGACDQCLAGRSHLCREGQTAHFSNRAFAVTGDILAGSLTSVPFPASPQLALIEPLSCVLHALDWARLTPDANVLVIGTGGLGLCLALALSAERPDHPFAVDDLRPERLAHIAGACPLAQPIATSAVTEYDVVFDLSGTEDGLRAATDRVIRGGRLCTMSHLDGYATADFLLAALTRRDVTFTVSYLNGERTNLARAASLIGERWTPAWDATIETVPFDALQDAFARRRLSPACKTIVRIA
jgi:threonine dehydrogenase-like Zn-dependent dehydrogenase